MKISELTRSRDVQKDMCFPVAYNGQNCSISVNQLLNAAEKSILFFDRFVNMATLYSTGTNETEGNVVVFDKVHNKFYLGVCTNVTRDEWTLFATWNGKAKYYNEADGVRNDVLWVDKSTNDIYWYNGTTLVPVAMTQADKSNFNERLTKATPIRVASEEAMEALIASGEVVEGQLYYIPEE